VSLQLQKAAVYLKLFYCFELKSDCSFFSQMCNKLKSFPLKSKYTNIIGLNLIGEHYYRNISFDDINKVCLDEIKKIKQIKPIMEKSDHFPYIIDRDFIEICIPAKGQSVKKLIDNTTKMDNFFSSLTEQVQWKKIEIHIKGGWEKKLIYDIAMLSMSCFSEKINKTLKMKNQLIEENTFSLPKNTEKLYDISTLNMSENKNSIVLQPVARMQLGLSIYSDQVGWFNETLQKFDELKLFSQPLPKKTYSALPHLAAF